MMEVRSETDYARHHIQKVIGFFAAMQQFAMELQEQGHQVIYMFLNDETNFHRFDQNCSYWIEKSKFTKFEYLLPDE
jgi:deoxyribodipyrimidine photolyase-related protein